MKDFVYWGLLLIMTLLTIWCAGFLLFVSNVATQEQSTASQEKADAIIILTGGKNRLEEGFFLFATKRASKVFISGVNENTTINDLLGRWDGAPLPSCCIVLGSAAINTQGNAIESATWISENNIKSIFLVTSDYHMPRAYMEFRSALPELAIYPHPVYFKKQAVLDTEFLELLFSEFHKFVFTYFRNLFVTPAA